MKPVLCVIVFSVVLEVHRPTLCPGLLLICLLILYRTTWLISHRPHYPPEVITQRPLAHLVK